MMDTRIAVRPSAPLLAWQDNGHMAPRRRQPEVQRLTPEASRLHPGTNGAKNVPVAAAENPATHNASGQLSVSSTRLVAAASWSRSDSIALQVQTAEGDMATLRFSQSGGLSLAAGTVRTDSGSAQALAWGTQSSTDSDLSVEGDLNDTEMSAINALAAQLAPVAGDFFGDNTDAALQKASLISIAGLGEAGASLNAFSYTLRSHEVLAATAMYERVGQAGGAPASLPSVEPEPIGSSEQAATPAPRPRDLLKQVLAMLEKLRELSGADPAPTATSTRTAPTAEPTASLPAAHVDVMV